MSFIDKFKSGVVEAGNKAKIVVEVNKLKLQNISKQNEINQQYQEIGRLVYESAEEGSWPPAREHFEENIIRVQQLKQEIEQNLLQIANLNDDKACPSCGQRVAFDARSCSKCGNAFEIIDISLEGSDEAPRRISEPEDFVRLEKPEKEDK